MSALGPDQVRTFISAHVAEQLRLEGRDGPEELVDDYDLLLSGVIDSLGLLELLNALSEFAGRELDFESLSPEEVTVVGPLSRLVAEQASAASPSPS